MVKKRLITSALPYVNNEPHLGNIIGCVLSADTYARFSRSKGYDTLYICGTDEYGTATETKAAQENLSPREICDKYHAIHKNIYKHFNISFDAFGRTSDDTHTGVVQEIYKQVEANDRLITKETEQFYNEAQGKFLADRLIEGTCPKCSYEDARGDQCDGCGSMLTPTELIDPRCASDGSKPSLRKTTHQYINIPGLEKELSEWQEKALKEGFWPNNATTTTRSWMNMDLEPRAITRDLKWGVPVPKEGFENKVFYVWFDAPIGYVSITKHAFPDTWKDWWFSPEDTQLYQFMAKDNIPFHSLLFPATQLASGQNWTMCHHLASTEYLNYEDSKFSKSRNVGVFGTDVIESGIHPDLWRFYLLSARPEKQDAAFCWKEFFDRVNNVLLDNIGNLINRSLVYVNKNFDGQLAEVALTEEQEAFVTEAKTAINAVTEAFEKVSIREALNLVLHVGKLGNRFFQEQEPWIRIKTNKDEVQGTVNILAHLIRDIGVMLEPFMPETSERILKMVNAEGQTWKDIADFTNLLGKTTNKPEILYPKLDTKLVEEFVEKFDGQEKIDPWDAVELKVGQIVEIENHPTAEHLYVEKIDLGEGRLRTIASGLVKHFEKEELLGKKVIVASNLSAADLRGVMSEGMVLCASKKKKMEVLNAEAFEIGALVHCEGEEATAKPEATGIDEFKLVELKAKDGLCYIGKKAMQVNGQTLTTELTLNGKIG